jgi:hypothetical protein
VITARHSRRLHLLIGLCGRMRAHLTVTAAGIEGAVNLERLP